MWICLKKNQINDGEYFSEKNGYHAVVMIDNLHSAIFLAYDKIARLMTHMHATNVDLVY